jgi:hypothetical protein
MTATNVQATIGGHVLDNLIKRIDIFRENGIGRWELTVDNTNDVTSLLSFGNEATVLGINNVSLMAGYLDDKNSDINDSTAVYNKNAKIVGRNYGRDLARLFITAKYADIKIDDLFEAALNLAGSEITYSSPSLGPRLKSEWKRTYL